MNTTRDKIREIAIESGIKNIGYIDNRPSFGDYAIIIKPSKEKIENLAEKIKSNKKAKQIFEKIETAPPVFINLYLKEEYLQNRIKDILKEKEITKKQKEKKKIQIEFISANPTGLLTLGNGRGAFTGDVLANILSRSGHKVQREFYINDAKNSKQIKTLGETALNKGTTYLTPYLKEKIKKTKIKTEDPGEAGYLLSKEIIKDIKKNTEKEFKIKFDNWFSEQDNIIQKNKHKKVYQKLKKYIYKKEKAEWLKTSKYGAEKDFVLVRDTGEPTYFLPDIAYHYNKFKERKFDKVIDIWGADHHGYIKRMKAAMEMLGIKKERLDIIIMQLVRLVKDGKEIKMSKRKGEYILLTDLIKEVGIDVARFFFLMHSNTRHMDFDLKLAKEKSQKNPVYYVQYAYARINSILKNAKNTKNKTKTLSKLTHKAELDLIKELIKLPEIIEDTANDYQVQRLPQYSQSLATAFHKFYDQCKVLDKKREKQDARLTLINATQLILENTLEIMGISQPKKM
ncbi:MAG: arginine--tRNA ligase [Candidatus Portnoybacteria bacterium]|nr:arginine--tRNA ligase [Candidatus Portnoybacteria bacterium]